MSLFDNATFPLCAIRGVSKSETFPVDVQTNGFNEYRSTPFEWEYFTWTIPSWGLLEDEKKSLVSFLRQRKYGLRSFLYQDPDMPSLQNNIVANYNGGTQWVLTLAYDDNVPGKHPIFHPGTLEVRKNGFIVGHSFSIVNGVPILNVPGSVPTDVIRVSGPIFYSVRLDSPFSWTITALNSTNTAAIATHADIQLKEVFEY